MEYIKIKDVELPDPMGLFQAIIDTRTADPAATTNIEKFLYVCTEAFLKATRVVNNLEFKEDPEYIADAYLELHEYNGGLLGLADAIHRKVKSVEYISKLQIPDGDKKALPHDAREYYARLEGTSIEGLVKMLTERQRTLLERINIQQGKIRRR
jgi:hypothetical protein